MKRKRGAYRWPLFLRIFCLMLLTVFLVQALNFVVIVLTPPPQPTFTTVDHIVAVLQGTTSPNEKLVVRKGGIDASDEAIGREAVLRDLIAHRLSLPVASVRVRLMIRMPGRLPFLPLSKGLPRSGFSDRLPQTFGAGSEIVLIGPFAVSAQRNGEWRTVELASSSFAPWRLRWFAWLITAMIVVAPVAWMLARGLARPIGLFASAAHSLGRNPKAPPLELSGPPEIREAAAAFNEMQGRLNRYVEDRTTLMAAIAHDLRTPLMRLALRLENTPEPLNRECESDIRDMEQMIDAVMSFVRDMTRPSRRQILDLRALTESVVDDFADRGCAVHLRDGGPLIIEGDPSALKSLINNLISNAVKYAEGAGISLSKDNAFVFIDVADEGPGMAAEDIERAFDPFFRAERSRNRDTGGIGLGLASVRSVARAHGGDATLSNHPNGGLLARVQLPI